MLQYLLYLVSYFTISKPLAEGYNTSMEEHANDKQAHISLGFYFIKIYFIENKIKALLAYLSIQHCHNNNFIIKAIISTEYRRQTLCFDPCSLLYYFL